MELHERKRRPLTFLGSASDRGQSRIASSGLIASKSGSGRAAGWASFINSVLFVSSSENRIRVLFLKNRPALRVLVMHGKRRCLPTYVNYLRCVRPSQVLLWGWGMSRRKMLEGGLGQVASEAMSDSGCIATGKCA